MTDFTEKELARLDRELESLLETATPVRARVAKNASLVFSIRLTGKELDEFSAAAKARGMTLSEFMRSATREALKPDGSGTGTGTYGDPGKS